MHRSFIDRLVLPVIFGLTTILVALTFWQMLESHWRAEMQAAVKEQASFVKTQNGVRVKSAHPANRALGPALAVP